MIKCPQCGIEEFKLGWRKNEQGGLPVICSNSHHVLWLTEELLWFHNPHKGHPVKKLDTGYILWVLEKYDDLSERYLNALLEVLDERQVNRPARLPAIWQKPEKSGYSKKPSQTKNYNAEGDIPF